MDHCLSQSDPLEHSLGVASHTSVSSILKAHQLEQLVNAISQQASAKTAELSIEGDGLRTGKKFVEIGILGEKTDVDAAFDFGTRDPKDLGGSRGGCHQTKKDLEGRALAGSVRPEKSVNMTCRDVEGEAPESGYLTATQRNREDLLEVADPDGGKFGIHLRK